MNLFRFFSELRRGEHYRSRSRLISKLQGKPYFDEDDINEILAYKQVEYHSNPDAKKITKKVFASDDLGEKFRLLKRLNGVGITVAATILTFQNPYKYAEVDPKSWNNLRLDFGFKASEKDCKSDYGVAEYSAYLDALKAIAEEYGMNLSDVAYTLSAIG